MENIAPRIAALACGFSQDLWICCNRSSPLWRSPSRIPAYLFRCGRRSTARRFLNPQFRKKSLRVWNRLLRVTE